MLGYWVTVALVVCAVVAVVTAVTGEALGDDPSASGSPTDPSTGRDGSEEGGTNPRMLPGDDAMVGGGHPRPTKPAART